MILRVQLLIAFLCVALVAVFTRGMVQRLLILVGLIAASIAYAVLTNGLGLGKPLDLTGVANAASTQLTFAPIRSPAQLDAALDSSARPSMLDFYADWCVSCKEMESLTFSDPRVHARLEQLGLLRADVTANDANDQALLKRFGLFGPPGIIFFDGSGREVLRVVGYESADRFLGRLERLPSSPPPHLLPGPYFMDGKANCAPSRTPPVGQRWVTVLRRV